MEIYFTYLIAKLTLNFMIGCLVVYMMLYILLEDYLSKRLIEPTFLKTMYISHRLTALVFFYGSAKGIFSVLHILFLLLTSRTPSRSDIISSVLLGFILVLTFCYRKTLWYYLIKNKQTVFADWYVKKFFSIDKNKENIEQAYAYLKKASELKPKSVFTWSMMAMLNEQCFDKSDLADEYLTKAREALKASGNAKDKAAFELAMGEIQLCRDNIDEGLAHLKKACDLNPCDFNKERYEKALKWENEEEDSLDS